MNFKYQMLVFFRIIAQFCNKDQDLRLELPVLGTSIPARMHGKPELHINVYIKCGKRFEGEAQPP